MHRDHEVHLRRKGRNFGVLGVLLAFIVIVFGVTVAKIQTGGFSEGFDHVARPALVPSGAEEANE
ncbi:hypothetical protein JANAI62_14930 [Jannaschia pagri]|uniref:Cytochrome C oxidase assembly protein n=1 Tax=Jannaschia pagri TaxID=2829797 RepID=A0ABQ4NKC4_9RHOB|nr:MULTISPECIES: hypothetical protein [unclassified Jannaschia]GIT91038.1 hypothetical protein JANAI61_14960 [Jannaschia sp. AI_61]GIT94870.1 hypothetical protein JANAI62_14930 [Jannaschia sp. AI_62]